MVLEAEEAPSSPPVPSELRRDVTIWGSFSRGHADVGGGQYYSLRLGDIDIALFATASAGYINFFFPAIRDATITLGPFERVNLIWAGESLLRIRESSLFNALIGGIDMIPADEHYKPFSESNHCR